jgi:hypothetical protein
MNPRILVAILVTVLSVVQVSASGPLGIYAIVEKVVFEPSEASPERIQVWGAFSYVEGPIPDAVIVVSRAQRGYMYFRLPAAPDGASWESDAKTIRNEWRDLKAVAGTLQAVGFGRWPGGARESPPGVILGPALRGHEASFRVRAATEKPESPARYMTNVGVVKLPDHGSHAWVVKQLRDAK